MAGHFEAKKHAYRQTQDGVVISFVMHPNDVDAAIATAALGTRYMIGFAEIGDDNRPVAEPVDAGDLKSPSQGSAGSNPAGSTKRKWSDLSYAEQAGIRCAEPEFQKFIRATNADDAAKIVRQICCVNSRSELNDPTNEPARGFWKNIERNYAAHLTDRQYASARHG